jgi:hypothetical protein
MMGRVKRCRYCEAEIAPLTAELAAEQGYDVRDFEWVHVYRHGDTVIANPYCDNGGEVEGPNGVEWEDETWAAPVDNDGTP